MNHLVGMAESKLQEVLQRLTIELIEVERQRAQAIAAASNAYNQRLAELQARIALIREELTRRRRNRFE